LPPAGVRHQLARGLFQAGEAAQVIALEASQGSASSGLLFLPGEQLRAEQ
jgi:hypothetical protein